MPVCGGIGRRIWQRHVIEADDVWLTRCCGLYLEDSPGSLMHQQLGRVGARHEIDADSVGVATGRGVVHASMEAALWLHACCAQRVTIARHVRTFKYDIVYMRNTEDFTNNLHDQD